MNAKLENDDHRILFIGLGSVGAQVLDLLLRIPQPLSIVTAGRDLRRLQLRTNLAALSGLHFQDNKNVSSVEIDLQNIEATAEVISRIKPTIIFASVTLQSWWVITTLTPESFKILDRAQVGPWLPMHLALIYNLMRAVRLSGITPHVISTSFPDVVHNVLAKHNLAPDIGIGNVSNAVPAIRMAASDLLGRPAPEISIRMVAHHYASHNISHNGHTGGSDVALQILHRGVDVTDSLPLTKLLPHAAQQFRRTGGRDGQVMTAASAAKVLFSFLDLTPTLLHAPGPNGLPGGYPVTINNGKVELSLPENISLSEAIRCNRSGQVLEGIESVEDDGTVIFTEREMEILERTIGYSKRKLKLDEVWDAAEELGSKFNNYRHFNGSSNLSIA